MFQFTAYDLSILLCFVWFNYSVYESNGVKIANFSGKIFPSGIAAESYKKAVDSAIEKLRNQEADRGGEASEVIEPPS